MTGVSGSGFHEVDETADPRARVAYLDAVTALEGTRNYKRQTFALMAIKPGDTVIDVGCGTGDDLRELTALVGASGRVVGVDTSQTMLEQARARTEGLNVELQVGNAHQLGFPDNTFDACRSDRVFQHLERPAQALAELVRVARPGASIVLADPDWDTMIFDASNIELMRRVREFMVDRHRNGFMGRRLFGMFRRAGLTDVSVTGVAVTATDWQPATLLGFVEAAHDMVSAGLASAKEVDEWLRDLQDRAAEGVFFSALMAFIVSGRKPVQ